MNVSRCANVISSIPVQMVVPQSGCCFSGCCTCINFAFLKTTEGILKLTEIILGAICQNLLISYGLTYSLSLGSSYYSFLTTVSAGVLTSLVLLICYVVSQRTFQLVRQSLFETFFNGITSFLYISSSCYLAFAVYTFLYPVYKITSIFQVYPAMSATYFLFVGISLFLIKFTSEMFTSGFIPKNNYVIGLFGGKVVGFVVGSIHGYDSWLAYKKYR